MSVSNAAVTNYEIPDRAGDIETDRITNSCCLASSQPGQEMLGAHFCAGRTLSKKPTKSNQTSPRRNGKTPQFVAHDGDLFMTDSYYTMTIGERGMPLSERACRAARNATPSTSQDAYMCQHCGRTCSSRIGILSHERTCNKQIGRDT